MRIAYLLVAAATVSTFVGGPAFAQQPPKATPATVQTKDAAPPRPGAIAQSQAEAQRLSDAFVAVADKVGPSVVQIDVTVREEGADQVLRWLGGRGDSPVARGTGSGVLFSPEGAILTNNHVIDGALTIAVHLRDGRVVPARLLGRDPDTDLAVIKIDATGLVPAHFADSDAARVGEWVVAIGSPFGFSNTVTAGILSAKGRGNLSENQIEDFLQTDASINQGNSGGPLCDLDGKVLGINAMILGTRTGSFGIGFAIPSNMARRVAEQITKTGHVERATIGIQAQDLTPDLAAAFKLDVRAGARVDQVQSDAPAAKAGVKPGDVIAAVGGHPVHDRVDLMREILSHDVGDSAVLEIIRGGKHYGANVTLGARHEEPVEPVPVQQQGVPQVGMGLRVRDLTAQQAQQVGYTHGGGATVITDVSPGSSADRASLKAGDIIVECDGIPNPTAADVQKAAADGELIVRVQRRGSAFYAALKK
jgi:Do/DeqQ family serine protease